MPSKAKTAFDANIQRATYFLDVHEEDHTTVGAPALKYRELPRGAVVFAVGALDCYISEISAQAIVEHLQDKVASPEHREVLSKVNKEIPTLALEVATLEQHQKRVQRIQEAVADHFQNRVSNHGTKAVAAVVQRLGGKSADFWSTIKAKGHKDAPKTLDDWTDKRHRIVHQGEKVSVRRPAARMCIEFITALVDEIEAIYESNKSP